MVVVILQLFYRLTRAHEPVKRPDVKFGLMKKTVSTYWREECTEIMNNIF